MIDSIPVAIATTFANGSTVNPEYQPPQRQWVGLTDEEIDEIWRTHLHRDSRVRAIEAKLKEKNT